VKRFAALVSELESKTKTNAKLEALARYFASAPPEDAAWGLFFLTGRRLKRLLPTKSLVAWTLEITGLEPWLVEESYSAVGDLAETIALLLEGPRLAPEAPPPPERHPGEQQGELFESPPGEGARGLDAPPRDDSLARWVEERLLPLRGASPDEQRRAVLAWWRALAPSEVYVLCKLLTGELRVGAQQTLVVRALAQASGASEGRIAHGLMGAWEPTPATLEKLLQKGGFSEDLAHPYPFFLASPLEGPVETLGSRSDWLAEWKWDGIRAQVVRRGASVAIWSRGEELVTDRFPELLDAVRALPPGTVLDGEVLAWRGDAPLPFGALQTRIGRVNLDEAVLAAAPVVFLAFDLLEDAGEDVRPRLLRERRSALVRLVEGRPDVLRLSPEVAETTWEGLARERASARERRVEGLMLKRLESPYGIGRKKGDWWKWKIEPLTIDAVLVYAQHGHGKRASLFTDYTFAVWHEGELLPIAKAYSGLTDAEIAELDGWIRAHTRDRFGPVRRVEPSRVFEIAFEAIRPSGRHRAGVAVRFPRILRERRDKKAEEADTLERVRTFLG
jgi:DNA ligase-1